MFYEVDVEDNIRIPPSMLDMELNNAALSIVKDRYERRFFSDIGFVLLVEDAEVSSEGKVIAGDPNIYYKVRFKCIVFELTVNEVVRGFVKDLVDFGAFVSLGAVEALLHLTQIAATRFVYDKKSKALVSQKPKLAVKKGDEILAKVSTVSWKTHITDTRVSITMRAPGLKDLNWTKKQVENAQGGAANQ